MERSEIKQLAITMASDTGLINLTRESLCAKAGISDGSFPHIMGCTFSVFLEEIKDEGSQDVGQNHTVTRGRANPGLRRDQILGAALTLSKETGYHKITRQSLALRADVSESLVSRYFGTMTQLRRAIMRKAVKNEVLEVIAQGLANQDPHAKKAPQELRSQAAALLAKS